MLPWRCKNSIPCVRHLVQYLDALNEAIMLLNLYPKMSFSCSSYIKNNEPGYSPAAFSHRKLYLLEALVVAAPLLHTVPSS